MARDLSSRLRRAEPLGGERRKRSEEERIRRACDFERKWLAHGISLEELAYYSLPFHEDEACERLGDEELCEEFLRGAQEWYEVTMEHGAESACKIPGARKELAEAYSP